jgi:formylglycine-generating enzyme required for sulfatase activity
MVCVPGGPFQYGCIAEVEEFGDCFPEPPLHEIFLPTFEIDAHEATVAEYWACVDAGACSRSTPGAGLLGEVQTTQIGWDYPINCVDWAQAVAYCEWMGKRLPSAMEWEKAARGSDGRLFPWGNEAPDCSRTVWWPDYPDGPGPYPAGAGCATGAPQPVGSRPAGASPYGALDMAGNVSEWVADDATNVSGDELIKMLRGGAFLHHEADVLYTFRQLGFTAVGDGNMFNGIRCARGP